MLNVGRIEEGFVLDHIKAGKSMTIYHDLKLDHHQKRPQQQNGKKRYHQSRMQRRYAGS